jgi:hypothetical protein
VIPLAIEAMGAVTSVGGRLVRTAASIDSMMRLFNAAVETEADDGPGIGAPSPQVAAAVHGVDRLCTLAAIALRECGAARERIPIVVCAPALDDFGCDTGGLLDGIRRDVPVSSDRNASRVLTGGRSSIVEALGWAGRLLTSGGWPACLLLGIDSRDGSRGGGNGRSRFVPGEAGAALRLTARVDRRCAAVIAGVGHCERAVRQKTGAAVLSQATQDALDVAAIPAARLAAVCSDGPGSAEHLEELAMALGRPPLCLARDPEMIIPAMSVGEVGAAAGVLSLVVLSFLFTKGALRGPALASFSSDGTARGAAVLSPSRRAVRAGRVASRVMDHG